MSSPQDATRLRLRCSAYLGRAVPLTEDPLDTVQAVLDKAELQQRELLESLAEKARRNP